MPDGGFAQPTLRGLGAVARWVAWQPEMRRGKLTKGPYGAHGEIARSDDPAT